MVPKQRIDLTEWFDRVDLGVESIGDRNDFEKFLTLRLKKEKEK